MTDSDITHLSIGEVLSLLQDEFPDVTISKIRFLESQGLIDPERTPSGYRKFFEADVDRLRWILQQQRDHFLPLKVIKDRLSDADRASLVLEFNPPPDVEAPMPDTPPTSAQESNPLDVQLEGPAERRSSSATETDSTPDTSAATELLPSAAPEEVEQMEHSEDTAADKADESNGAPEPDSADAPVETPGPDHASDAEMRVETPASNDAAHMAASTDANLMDLGPTDMTLTADELSRTAGVSLGTIEELRAFGLLVTHQVGPDEFFDGDSVLVAKAAARFAEYGVETRHLRMYKVASEREAGFFEQVIMPLLKQRNPAARQRAVEQVATMAALGQQLHAAMLRQSLDDSIG